MKNSSSFGIVYVFEILTQSESLKMEAGWVATKNYADDETHLCVFDTIWRVGYNCAMSALGIGLSVSSYYFFGFCDRRHRFEGITKWELEYVIERRASYLKKRRIQISSAISKWICCEGGQLICIATHDARINNKCVPPLPLRMRTICIIGFLFRSLTSPLNTSTQVGE